MCDAHGVHVLDGLEDLTNVMHRLLLCVGLIAIDELLQQLTSRDTEEKG